jgi:hypothetical protein
MFTSTPTPMSTNIFGNPINNAFQSQLFNSGFPQTNFPAMTTFPGTMSIDPASSFMGRPIDQNPFIQHFQTKDKSSSLFSTD